VRAGHAGDQGDGGRRRLFQNDGKASASGSSGEPPGARSSGAGQRVRVCTAGELEPATAPKTPMAW
jgi:hypothetical protein